MIDVAVVVDDASFAPTTLITSDPEVLMKPSVAS
jgi:hypothetical protein